MKLKAKKSIKGFTLVESMVAIFIFTFLLGACMMILLSGSDSWQTNKVQVDLQQELRRSMDWIKEDLRQTASSQITTPSLGSNGSAISFPTSLGAPAGTIVWGAQPSIQYALGGSGSNELQRTQDGTTRVIALNIQSLIFTRPSSTPNIVTVTLQAQKDSITGHALTENLNFDVHLRN